jgi:hypothetical protein
MRLALALVAIVAISAGSAFGWAEPEKFRGVPWGATKQEALTILQAAGAEKCSQVSSPGTCMVNAHIGPVAAYISFHFGKSDAFEQAMLFFSPDSYGELRGIFIDRYGPPTATNETTIQNRFGATYTNEIVEWSGERVHIMLRRYFTTLDQGLGIIQLKTVYDRSREADEKARKKGKEDL